MATQPQLGGQQKRNYRGKSLKYGRFWYSNLFCLFLFFLCYGRFFVTILIAIAITQTY